MPILSWLSSEVNYAERRATSISIFKKVADDLQGLITEIEEVKQTTSDEIAKLAEKHSSLELEGKLTFDSLTKIKTIL